MILSGRAGRACGAAGHRHGARPAALAEAGAVIALDAAAEFETRFDAAAARLIAEGALRRRLSIAAAGICDGRGADRVADAFLALLRQRAG